MPDHVGIREVEDDQIIMGQACQHLVGDEPRAHLRLQIVGRDFWRRHNLPVFSGKGALDSAVKKISHVRILFRFGNAQL